MRWFKEQRGSIVLEAAVVLPLFLAFVILLTVFIRISLTEMALQSAVSETAKVVAANMYPIEIAYRQGQAKWASSSASAWLNNVVSRVDSTRQKAIDAETFVEDYERWIPDPLVQLVAWEKQHREQVENWGGDMTNEAKNLLDEKLAEAATPLLAGFADTKRLDKQKLKVTKLTFPNFDQKEEAYFSIEAQYEFTFLVPFFKRSVTVKKKATERAWVGGG